jgi:hypothetical protein
MFNPPNAASKQAVLQRWLRAILRLVELMPSHPALANSTAWQPQPGPQPTRGAAQPQPQPQPQHKHPQQQQQQHHHHTHQPQAKPAGGGSGGGAPAVAPAAAGGGEGKAAGGGGAVGSGGSGAQKGREGGAGSDGGGEATAGTPGGTTGGQPKGTPAAGPDTTDKVRVPTEAGRLRLETWLTGFSAASLHAEINGGASAPRRLRRRPGPGRAAAVASWAGPTSWSSRCTTTTDRCAVLRNLRVHK